MVEEKLISEGNEEDKKISLEGSLIEWCSSIISVQIIVRIRNVKITKMENVIDIRGFQREDMIKYIMLKLNKNKKQNVT